MGQQGRIVNHRHGVAADTLHQIDNLLASAMLERLFPDWFHLGGVTPDTGGRASVVIEARVGEYLLHPEFHHQPIPVLAAAAPQNEIKRPIFRLIAVVRWVGVVVEMEAVPVVGIAHRVPHDPSHMQERAELAYRDALALAGSYPMKQRREDRLRGEDSSVEPRYVGANAHRRITDSPQ